MRILVVDDDESIREVVREILLCAGYEAVLACDGLEALQVLDESIDFVLTDFMMPRMDGVAFVRALQQRHFKKPVVFMTATPGGLPEGYKVLVKPFDLEEMLRVIVAYE